MNYILHMVPGLQCHGCSRMGYCDRTTLLCAYCIGEQLAKQEKLRRPPLWRKTLKELAEKLKILAIKPTP